MLRSTDAADAGNVAATDCLPLPCAASDCIAAAQQKLTKSQHARAARARAAEQRACTRERSEAERDGARQHEGVCKVSRVQLPARLREAVHAAKDEVLGRIALWPQVAQAAPELRCIDSAVLVPAQHRF